MQKDLRQIAAYRHLLELNELKTLISGVKRQSRVPTKVYHINNTLDNWPGQGLDGNYLCVIVVKDMMHK